MICWPILMPFTSTIGPAAAISRPTGFTICAGSPVLRTYKVIAGRWFWSIGT
jgi:hypothetical protein